MAIKRLAMIRTGWLPTRQANGIQVIRMCEAFAALGLEVTLYYIPSSVLRAEVADFYGIKRPFTLKPLPRAVLPMRKSFKLERWTSFPSFVHALIWSGFVIYMLCREKADFYLVRDPVLAWWLARRALPTVLEMHELPSGLERTFVRRVAREDCIKLIISVTEHLRADLVNRLGIPSEKSVTLHDGVDLETFGLSTTKDEARQLLGLPLDRPLVVYTGQLYVEKGIDTLVNALPMLGSAQAIVVGGTQEDVRRVQKVAGEVGALNVRLVGYVLPPKVPLYLNAADVLVLPFLANLDHWANHSSPLKLFEYMASRRPIVASRLPGLEEVLTDGENALLYAPGDPVALGRAINRLLSDRALCEKLSAQAYQDVRSYSWESRAKTILEFMDLHV
jgi:glycosyltransferase involved in cell wall biosynthesis